MKQEHGDWTQYRTLPDCIEVDFHFGRRDPGVPYDDAMAEVTAIANKAIRDAYAIGLQYVLMTHGRSTSRQGQTTARSQVRALIRSKAMTPIIIRRECIQHDSCVVVALRPNPNAQRPTLACPKCGESRLEPRHAGEGAGRFQCTRRGCKHVFNWFLCCRDPFRA